MASMIVFAVLFGVIPRAAYGASLLPSEIKPFIIGGEDAPTAYAPHMAALIFGDRLQFQLCGGSIITRSLILTAAHCLEPVILEDGGLLGSFHMRVGSNQWNSGGTIAKVKDYYMHPKWDSINIKFDAAVVVLKQKLVLSKYIALIKLAYDFVEGNEGAFVTGWGRTGPRIEGNVVHMQPTPDNAQLLYVTTMDHELCQKLMIAVAGHRAPPIQRTVEICTFHSPGHGMCHGDSGSALVRAGSREQIGIVSWGYACAVGAPDVFVRMYGIEDFLKPIFELYKD